MESVEWYTIVVSSAEKCCQFNGLFIQNQLFYYIGCHYIINILWGDVQETKYFDAKRFLTLRI